MDIPPVFCQGAGITSGRERLIISTDIGGADPDDFQSMIRFLMYADKFETEGLISSPYGRGLICKTYE